MDEQDESCFIPLADVRGSKDSGDDGKLLFQLVAGPCGITILLKMKGEKDIYAVPIYILLEPFITEAELLRQVTRCEEYRRSLIELKVNNNQIP